MLSRSLLDEVSQSGRRRRRCVHDTACGSVPRSRSGAHQVSKHTCWGPRPGQRSVPASPAHTRRCKILSPQISSRRHPLGQCWGRKWDQKWALVPPPPPRPLFPLSCLPAWNALPRRQPASFLFSQGAVRGQPGSVRSRPKPARQEGHPAHQNSLAVRELGEAGRRETPRFAEPL